MIFKYFIISLLILSNLLCSIVSDIKITGNSKTHDEIILREIKHPMSEIYDSTKSKEDKERIYNLGIFSNVQIEQIDSTYHITVIETFQYLPIPILEYDEGHGVSFGVGLAYLNFRGQNEQLLFSLVRGTSYEYYFDYYNPWAYGDHGSLFAQIYQTEYTSINYYINYLEKGFFLGTGIHKDRYHKYKCVIGHEFILIKKDENESKIKKNYVNYDSSYRYFDIILDYRYDTRDIYIDPSIGRLLRLIINPKIGISTNHRLNVDLSIRNYFKISNIPLDPIVSLYSKLVFKSTKNIPVFENLSLGGEDFVRGYSPVFELNNKKIKNNLEGTQIIYQNIELQHTLVERKSVNGIELGADIAYFFDLGVADYKIYSLKFNNLIYGYGCGLRLFISGLGVINFDIGFNPYGDWYFHPSDD